MEFLFVEPDREELPNEPLPLSNANAYLNDLNEYLQENQQSKVYPFKLLYEGKELYQSTLSLPTKDDFSLQHAIELELKELDTQEACTFLEWLLPFFSEGPPPKKGLKKTLRSKASTTKDLSAVAKKVFFVGVILVVGLSVFAFFRPFGGEEKESYSELMETNAYLEAGKRYPEKQVEIEQVLYETVLNKRTNKKIEQLEAFNQHYPTTFGNFDLAILAQDYQTAIEVYEHHKKDFKKTTDRQTLVGYCYLKVDKKNQAHELAESLDSVELQKYVATYDQYQDQIKELEKQLADLKKEPVKQREAIEETMNLLYDTKEKLKNL